MAMKDCSFITINFKEAKGSDFNWSKNGNSCIAKSVKRGADLSDKYNKKKPLFNNCFKKFRK